MNEIKISVDFTKGTIKQEGINLISGDFKSTKMNFTFDADYSANTLVFEMKKPNGELAFVKQIPSSNEIVLVAYTEDEEGEEVECSIFESAGRYTYEISLYKDGGKITSASDSLIVEKEEVVIDDVTIEYQFPIYEEILTEFSKLNGGATGKVLAKKSGENFDFEWVDNQGGGGGGTYDYTELDNKPKINGVELNGNKSLNALGINIPTKTSDLTNDSGFITSAYHDSTKADVSTTYTKTEVDTAISNHHDSTKADKSVVDTIEGKIPSQATSSNKLADKDFVNSSINSVTAFYITKNADGDQFASYSELESATTFYSGGEVRVPTRNDYAIVVDDEEHDNSTTRYIYQNGWEFQYIVNETALTSEQIASLNSGITSGLVASYNSHIADTTKHITASERTAWNGKENASNKVTSISSTSTDTEYPSAKCVYDIVGNVEALLEAML